MLIKNEVGNSFGSLIVLEQRGQNWICKCECGRISEVHANNVRRRTSKKCGCSQSIISRGARLEHGGSKLPEYAAWSGAKKRCFNPNTAKYKDYGARGITMCDEWKNNFSRFLSDMGIKPSPNHSLERRDVNGDYSLQNCKWGTAIEQAKNKQAKKLHEFSDEEIFKESQRRLENLKKESYV